MHLPHAKKQPKAHPQAPPLWGPHHPYHSRDRHHATRDSSQALEPTASIQACWPCLAHSFAPKPWESFSSTFPPPPASCRPLVLPYVAFCGVACPFLWELWVTNYFFNDSCLLIYWPHQNGMIINSTFWNRGGGGVEKCSWIFYLVAQSGKFKHYSQNCMQITPTGHCFIIFYVVLVNMRFCFGSVGHSAYCLREMPHWWKPSSCRREI